MPGEVAECTVVLLTSTGSAGDEFLENQAAPHDYCRAFLIIFLFLLSFLIRFFHSWVPKAAEIPGSP